MPPAEKTPSKKSGTLPGGYTVGDKVFYTGASHTFDDGDTLVHGGQGEVAGPATGENTKGKGVAVLFPGNKLNVACYLTNVCRLRAASAAAPHTRCFTSHAFPRQPAAQHEQPLQPNARVWEGWWLAALLGPVASLAAPERGAAEP